MRFAVRRIVPWTRRVAELPLLALRDAVVCPEEVTTVAVGREQSVRAVLAAWEGDGFVVVVAQRSADINDPGPADLVAVGCVARLLAIEAEEVGFSVKLNGVQRVRVTKLDQAGDGAAQIAHVEAIAERVDAEPPLDAVTVTVLRDLATSLLRKSGWSRRAAEEHVGAAAGPGRIADIIIGTLALSAGDKQRLLETLDVNERVHALFALDELRFDDTDEPAAAGGWWRRLFRR